jgi:hypothetical protein
MNARLQVAHLHQRPTRWRPVVYSIHGGRDRQVRFEECP